MKESQKQILNNVKAGLIKLLKIIWIVLKSFFEAITWDFYDNVKKYWKKDIKVQEKPAEKAEEPKKP
ncbi:MAG: hypothetical protein Q8O03_08295 [Nanoarchaeota archaeon]|nr:hypothetical protein [Nanoarchaeota archaeon]